MSLFLGKIASAYSRVKEVREALMSTQLSQDLKKNEDSTAWVDWNHNLFSTRLFDAISILLPNGESFIINVAQEIHQQEQENTPLKNELLHFTEEEKSHQRAHHLYNARVANGFPGLPEFEKSIATDLACFKTQYSLNAQICLASAFEYLTAIISHLAIGSNSKSSKSGWLSQVENQQTALWRWHCAEELGHWSLFLKVIEARNIKYRLRLFCFLLATFYLAFDLARYTSALCWHDFKQGHTHLLQILWQIARFTVKNIPGFCWGFLKWASYALPVSRVKNLMSIHH
jgi:uncharacterized protein